MLSREDQKYVIHLTKELLPSVMREIGFDNTLKEVGHSFGEKLEEELVRQLVDKDDNFAEPVKEKGKGKQTRKMEDLTYKKHLLNVKFGYDKKGQPNMCAFNRLLERFVKNEIDSYWILSIDGKDNKICFFNLYEHLEYTNTNIGTGQTMLTETRFYKDFNQDEDYATSRKDVIMKLKDISEIAVKSHTDLKLKQQEKRLELLNGALSVL